MEQISVLATGYYFDLLLQQVNLKIAESNYTNTKNILQIANEKFALGKISKNEILQLQLEELKAQKAVGIAKRDLEIASLNLKSFTGLQSTSNIKLTIPDEFPDRAPGERNNAVDAPGFRLVFVES